MTTIRLYNKEPGPRYRGKAGEIYLESTNEIVEFDGGGSGGAGGAAGAGASGDGGSGSIIIRPAPTTIQPQIYLT